MSSIESPAIERGSALLVTGANGYIGSHVVDQLLAAGYRIFDARYGTGKFETIVVGDMAQEGALDEAVKGVSGVVHVATVMNFSKTPAEVIPPTIAFTVNALVSAAKESSHRRNDLNTEAVEAAYANATPDRVRPWAVYGASKTLAEQEAWKFVNEWNPRFILNTVLTSATLGEVLDTKNQGYPSTSAWCKMAFEGQADALRQLPPQFFVNVKDVARLHVAALIDAEVESERIIAFAEPFNWNGIFASLRRLYPERTFPDELPDEPRDLGSVPTARGAELLRKFGREGWTGLDETVRDNTKDIIES